MIYTYILCINGNDFHLLASKYSRGLSSASLIVVTSSKFFAGVAGYFDCIAFCSLGKSSHMLFLIVGVINSRVLFLGLEYLTNIVLFITKNRKQKVLM